MSKFRPDKTVIVRNGVAMNIDTPEGQKAMGEVLDDREQKLKQQKAEVVRQIESSGMEPLKQTEMRLRQPLEERIAQAKLSLKEVRARAKGPKANFTHVPGRGSPAEQLAERVKAMEDEETELRGEIDAMCGKSIEIIQGIAALERGEKPSSAFMAYLAEREEAVARAVWHSKDSATKDFKSSREELHALAELRALAESL